MPYTSKGKCVYKKDTGEKVGCTKGPVKKYLAALHANVPDAKDEGNIKLSSLVPKLEGEEEKYNRYDRGDMGAQWRSDQQYDLYHDDQKRHLDAKKAKGNAYGSDQIPGGVEDKADLAKMSPEDQKKAMNCLLIFQMSNQQKNIPERKIIDAAIELENLNKKYHTNVGNVTRK